MHNETEATKFELIIKNLNDAIVTVSPKQHITYINPGFERLTGFHSNDIVNETIRILSPKISDPLLRSRPFDPSLLEGEGTFEDYLIQKKDGSQVPVDLIVKKILASNEPFLLILIRDISEKKRLEKELIFKHAELQNAFIELEKAHTELKSTQELLVQAGKMAALGELTAGISHELNQPLQAIRGYSQECITLLMSVKNTDSQIQEIQNHLKEVIQGADKMRKIIDTLRTFVRRSTEKMEEFDIHESIDAAFKMFERQLLTRGIQIERHYSKDLPKIYANPVQLEQVFINLTSNARDAIEATQKGSGTIKVKTHKKNDFVEVEFSDNGIGMSESTQSKAFNPFFTTKEVGKGMGLGLSLSYGILTKLNASIQIQSKLGYGTTFLLRIPIDYRRL